ncbi:MAG: hypothetical protein QNL01_07175 [Akkermansiaceae bacterium]|jgi:hypothetical protein|tara:strand:- start:823 stop:1557 length:735 start_codon:yes stop_codon:yes gene_type:complete
MKTLSALTFPLTLLALSLPTCLSADVEDAIPIGIEAVTGYRSTYVHRGFELAEGTLDFQIEAEIAINDNTFVNIGAWYATESGSGDFDETAFFAHLRFEQSEKLTLGLSATYRNFSHSTPPLSVIFEDGVDVGAFATWHFSKDFNVTTGAYYDTGAEAWYGHVATRWSKEVSEKAYFSLKTGVSYVNDYYGRDGMNDVYSRLSFTYHISETVSVTPFVGGSVLLDNDDAGGDHAFGGVWFEVRF